MDNSIGIYIHIPFCKSKCNYCDFNSYSGREHLAGPYFNALFSEMKMRADLLEGRPVRTVFIGGGTPTLVEPKHIGSLLELCSKHFNMDSNAEISMESNPGTLSYESLKAYRAAGVNRLSIGLQAWQDRLLKELGRIHDNRQFVNNFEAAVKVGFRNINVDLIFGLPGQTFEDWAETLEAVTALGDGAMSSPGITSGHGSVAKSNPGITSGHGSDTISNPGTISGIGSRLTHLSCYSLKIEEGTNFGDRVEAGTLKPADDDLDRRMYRYAIEFLALKGYRHYEISNFARPGYECRHNLIYWKALEYAGFGAGAHSYLDGSRFSNVAGIEQYIEAVKQAGESDSRHSGLYEDIQSIDRQDSMSEFMMLGLRLIDGVSAEEFEARFDVSLQSVYGDKLEKLVKRGFLERVGSPGNNGRITGVGSPEGRYRLTATGLDLGNKVFVEFI